MLNQNTPLNTLVISHDGAVRGRLIHAGKKMATVNNSGEEKRISLSKLGLWHRGPSLTAPSARKLQRRNAKLARKANRVNSSHRYR